ncbi:FGFR1 oncogene partner-like isoform X2 [Temnothorax curvispinosus]|uniref:FGFR1 oncogene partner-like isoform X2 n=1 Tax=Temnothorax curvispinosus TaxID=300111 RepID=A0A6J1PX75_9HYME|nr:FGFR1 oncogene partner-like isoform X2 [Temnothorax curvispinosus]
MIDGNISMEEDTELRDLVVQTLESNGVLAKIRAELRASVFLALEEQDSVMNPEPLLNKTVKQYLSNSEGKLLFSLVREFLEYFGLDYTISVYDPETYFGKEYNYVGRNKLCEELGIDSTEPLLGEILKNSINGAFNSSQKNKTSNRHDETDEATTNFANATFEVSVPKIIHTESVSSSNDNDSSEKLESISEQSPKVPINVTITDKKCKDPPRGADDVVTDTSAYDKHQSSLRESTMDTDGIEGNRNNNVTFDKSTATPHGTCTATNDVAAQETDDSTVTSNQMSPLNKSESLIKFDDSIVIDTQANQNEDISKQNSINSLDLSIENNVQSKKPVNAGSNFGKTIYFDEIIVGGERKNVSTMNKAEPFLEGLPTINQKATSIFSDLPPLNGKKANINDLKELMDIGLDGIDNYEEDFVSSASGSANEQSPTKEPDKMDSPLNVRTKKEEKPQSARTEDLSEEIEEMDEILSSTSCLEDINTDKNISNFATGITADYT